MAASIVKQKAAGLTDDEIKFPGDYSGEATPVPIPNTAVKLSRADGTAVSVGEICNCSNLKVIEPDIARNEGSYKNLMNQYRKFQLLILDEWMLVSLKENEARDVLEIVHARHHKGSTIFVHNFHRQAGMPRLVRQLIADTILDRIVHDYYITEIHSDADDGDSMCELYRIKRIKRN